MKLDNRHRIATVAGIALAIATAGGAAAYALGSTGSPARPATRTANLQPIDDNRHEVRPSPTRTADASGRAAHRKGTAKPARATAAPPKAVSPTASRRDEQETETHRTSEEATEDRRDHDETEDAADDGGHHGGDDASGRDDDSGRDDSSGHG